MEFKAYQGTAHTTSKLPLTKPNDVLPPLLGLASEIGSLLDVYKRYLRDGTDLKHSNAFFKEELGDILWYTAAVATAAGLDLEEIAVENLAKASRLYPTSDQTSQLAHLPVLDAAYPITERFPRRLVIGFSESEVNGQQVASLRLIAAEPNAFPDGPVVVNGKICGFKLGDPVGATLNDNSRLPDDYRFHDAIHLGFVAVLGWSPTMRDLLHLKRRSNPTTDTADDGARAVYAEEGLSAVLSHLAPRRIGFRTEASVDSSTLMVVQAASAGLEVEQLPLWVWRHAISQGFNAMEQLAKHKGGYLTADLDARVLSYSDSPDANK